MQIPNDNLLSFTETSDALSNSPNQSKKSHFQIKRIFVLIVISIFEMLVFFQRACPTVVTDDLSKDYGVPVSDLGIFTSMFYYPYSLLQPVAGLLADIIEPSYVLCFSGVVTATGDVICGLCNTLFGGSIGRFIVGFGCSFVPSCSIRMILNWFPLEHYSKILGIFLFFGGLGGILAQTPFTLLSGIIGWRWCFFSIAIISILFSIITVFFVRGNPIAHGYPAVNESLAKNASDSSVSEKINTLLKNIKTIISNSNFWFTAIFVFCANGAFFNITGIWGGPYLKEMLGYDSIKASNALLGLSLGGLLGSLINPYLVDSFRLPRKWVIISATIIAIICCIPLGFFTEKLSFTLVISLFFVFSLMTNGFAAVLSPMILGLFHPSAGSSVGGCLNCFGFISLIIFMPLTGKLLDHFGTYPDNPNIHNPEGFKYGLWTFNICVLSFGTFFLMFFRNKKKEEVPLSSIENYEVFK